MVGKGYSFGNAGSDKGWMKGTGSKGDASNGGKTLGTPKPHKGVEDEALH